MSRPLSNVIVESALIENNLRPVSRFHNLLSSVIIKSEDLYKPEKKEETQFDERAKEFYFCCDCKRIPELLNGDKITKVRDTYPIHSVQFSHDGKHLLCGTSDSSIHKIKLNENDVAAIKPSLWHLGMPITSLRFMPKNCYWCLGCSSHGNVFSFNLEHENFETLAREPQQTYCIDLSCCGQYMVTGGNDCYLRLYKLTPSGARGFKILNHSFGPNTTRDINENEVYGERWIKHPCQKKRSFLPKHDNLAHLCSTQDDFSPIYSKGQTQFNELNLFEAQREIVEGATNVDLDISAKNFEETTCYSKSENIKLCNVNYPKTEGLVLGRKKTEDFISQNIQSGHTMKIMAVKFHPEIAEIFVTASWDKIIKIWDFRTNRDPVNQIYGPFVCSPDALDMDDQCILTGSYTFKNSLEIWDMRYLKKDAAEIINMTDDRYTDFDKIYQDRNHKSPEANKSLRSIVHASGCSSWEEDPLKTKGEYIYAARLLPSRSVVCGGSGFGEVRVISRDTKMPIIRYPVEGVINTIDTIFDGRSVGVGCSDGSVHWIKLK